jgi:U6 snRNA-associated Sm-like protein LSm8
MENFLEKQVSVVTCDGRNYLGILKGLDQATNVVLERCIENIFHSTEGVKQVNRGLYLIRGNNVYFSYFLTNLEF